MVDSIYTRTWRWDSRTGRLAVEWRSIQHPERGNRIDLMMERWEWDCPGELKEEGRNEAVEVPERDVESSVIVPIVGG